MAKGLYAMCGIDEEELRRLFEELHTVRAVAARLGVTRRTLSKYRKELGLEVVSHRPKCPATTLSFDGDFGAVAQWLQAHPTERLKYDYHEAAEQTGIPLDVIRRYVDRRSAKIARWAKALGDLRTLESTTLVDTHGRKLPLRFVSDYTVKGDGRMGTVRVFAKLNTSQTWEVVLSIEAFGKLFYEDFAVQTKRRAALLAGE